MDVTLFLILTQASLHRLREERSVPKASENWDEFFAWERIEYNAIARIVEILSHAVKQTAGFYSIVACNDDWRQKGEGGHKAVIEMYQYAIDNFPETE